MERDLRELDLLLGERLRSARQAAGLSTCELADKLGVTERAISHYELALVRCPAAVLYKASQVLDVELVSFFENITSH